MTTNVTYIVDDQDASITYLCPVNNQVVHSSFFRNTWTSISSQSCGNQWFKHTFSGTGVSVAAPASRYGQNYTVQIDDGQALRPYGRGFYQKDDLEDGEHTIIYAVGDESLYPALDYLTVTAGSSTSLQGRSIIIDNNDDGLQWSGNWSSSPPSMLVFNYSNGPYKGSAHWSNTVGDTVKLQFTGTSISVYGILTSNTSGGDIIATYSLDGQPTVMSLPEGVANQTTPMARLFTTETTTGTHTLVVNITDIASSLNYLGIDFVVYNSSLDDAVSVQNSWGVSASVTPSGSAAVEDSTPVKSIVGGVVGGIVCMVLLGLLFLVLRNRKQRRLATRAASRRMFVKLEEGKRESWNDMKKPLGNDPFATPVPVLLKH